MNKQINHVSSNLGVYRCCGKRSSRALKEGHRADLTDKVLFW